MYYLKKSIHRMRQMLPTPKEHITSAYLKEERMGAQLTEAKSYQRREIHQAKINLITAQKLMDPTINFKELIKMQAPEETIKKRLCLANYSKKII